MMVFENFPKTRPELPPAYQAIYAEQYKENREGGSAAAGLAQKLEAWMHRKVAADVQSLPDRATLEIGAGTLNQLKYEPHAAPYDVVEPFRYLFESSPELPRVRSIYDDIADVPAENRYDRVTSIAAFEHICDLPEVVARCALLLNERGTLRCAIPSEGTILWRLGYTFTTGLEFKRKHGLDYEVLMRHEHVNTAAEIEAVLRYFFGQVGRSVFGVARALSIYQFYECSRPDRDRCELYLNSRGSV